jgi:heavy metal sensor kinase
VNLPKRTLRLRLTAWYVLLAGLTLVAFGLYSYYRSETRLLQQVDDGLRTATAQALSSLSVDNDRLTLENREKVAVAQPGRIEIAISVVSASGQMIDHLGYVPSSLAAPVIPGFSTARTGDIRWRSYSQPAENDAGQQLGWVRATQSLQTTDDAIEALGQPLFLVLPVVLAVMAATGYFLAGRSLNPVGRITRIAESIRSEDLSRRVGHSGPPDEIGRLAATFDHMLDRVEAGFKRERRFTADASHELRTPLTAMKGRIEVTLKRPRTVQEYQNTLRDLEAEVDRLIHLSSDLLLLARLGQTVMGESPDSLDLGELIEAVADQMRPLAEERHVLVGTAAPPGLIVKGEPGNLIRLFINLVANAIAYSPPGEKVTLEAGKTGDWAEVAVSDKGPGIPSEHLAHLFEPFYQVDESRSTEAEGAGLGLAIAREIAVRHGGRLEVRSGVSKGTTFVVLLPSSNMPPLH